MFTSVFCVLYSGVSSTYLSHPRWWRRSNDDNDDTDDIEDDARLGRRVSRR